MTDALFPATGMPDRDWWSALWPDPQAVLSDLGIEAGMTVIDLCCGDGYFTAPLARLVDGKLYALDIDPQMIELARAEVARVGATVIAWIEGNALDLGQYVPEPVDFVLMANTFHGVPDKAQLATVVCRALNGHGHFGIVNWHKVSREETRVLGKPRGPKTEMRMSPQEVRALVEPAGFELESIVELAPYHYGTVFRKHAAPD